MKELDDFFKKVVACPKCKGSLGFANDEMECSKCLEKYPIKNGIPVLLDAHKHADLLLSTEKWDEEYKKLSMKDLEEEKRRYDEVDLGETLAYVDKFILPEHKVFLELGCGPAFLSLDMARKGYTVICVDISMEALKIARKFFEKENLKGYFVCCNILEMPFKDNIVDFSNGSGVIEHFKDTQKSVDELFRITKPGGVALNTVPYLSIAIFYRQLWGNVPDVPVLKQLGEFIHIKLLKSKHMIFGYEKSFSRRKMKKVFGRAGFKDVETGLFECYLPLAFVKNLKIKKFLRKLCRSQIFWPMIYIYAKKDK